MLTAASARGQGMGTMALQQSLEIAAGKGCILCDLWTGMAGSVTHFYRKSGFVPVLKWFDYELVLR